MPLQDVQCPPTHGVQHAHPTVAIGRSQPAPVGGGDQGQNRAPMGFQGVQRTPADRVPQAHRAIVAGRGQPAPFRGSGQDPNLAPMFL